MNRKTKFIITCEHGGNKIPSKYSHLFDSKGKAALNTHRGWDPGALIIAKAIKKQLKVPLIYAEISRLLIDLNRSLGNKGSFSEFSDSLNDSDKSKVIAAHYASYRTEVEQAIAKEVSKNSKVLHFSMHSFTPVFNGETRNCEIGLLYDPKRNTESEISRYIKAELKISHPELRVRLNYPYKGTSDGFTPYLRKKNPDRSYSGIEIEFNHGYFKGENLALIAKTIGQILLKYQASLR